MKKRFLLIPALFFIITPVFPVVAQDDPVIDRIIRTGTTDNRTMQHLDVLTNRIGGRIVGSYAYDNAVQWIARMFTEWGLEVKVQEAGEVPVGFYRGPWFGRMLDDRDGMTLHFSTPSYTSGTKGVQRGHVVIEPKTRAQFERMKGKLNGAWVLVTGTNNGYPIDYSSRGDALRAGIIRRNEAAARYNDSLRRAHPDTPTSRLELKEPEDSPALFYKEMRQAGILGIIQSSPVPITALYDRPNIMEMDFYGNLPDCPDIKLDENQYRIIERKVKERRYFQLEFDIRNHFRQGPVKYHNVVGIIRGTEFPDEYVMTGGHIDSYDSATGGVDCGTGIAPNMEAARLIMEAGGKPRRTILFTMWAAEEFGLLGSKFWVENNRDKHRKISNYFNRDGGPTVANSLTVSPAMYEDFRWATQRLNEIDPDFPFTLNKRTSPPPPRPTVAGGSDHAWFAIHGVPVVSFGTGDPKGYDFRYTDIWHTERDTYDMSIPEYMEHTAVVHAIVVYNLANLDHLLSREGLYGN